MYHNSLPYSHSLTFSLLSFPFSPFSSLFTPIHALAGGENYKKHKLYASFLQMCCDANNVLRRKSSLWITLFVLMQVRPCDRL